MKISILSGSPRNNSVTYRMALFLAEEISTKSIHTVKIIDVRAHTLPVCMGLTYVKEENTPAEHLQLRSDMLESDAFILLTPEYNGAYTAALKNLVDHFAKDAFYHKVMGIVTASTGAMGGMRAAVLMQQLICALFGIPVPHMLVTPFVDKKFDEFGKLTDPAFQKSIDNFINEFLWMAERLK